jgi:hypothetical protein
MMPTNYMHPLFEIEDTHLTQSDASTRILQRNLQLNGPTAPEGQEKNWVPTISGKGWFSYFRLFGPTEPYFDKTWVLPNIELME